MKKESPLEALLAVHIRADKLPEPKRQAQLNPERK
jgi:hypothetical protein